jgi:hypothetical protein
VSYARPDRADDAELTFAIFTKPGCRKVARRIALEAKRRHLTVVHQHDRGWLSRYHLIHVRGDSRSVLGFNKMLNRWTYTARDGKPPPDLAELWKRIAGEQPPSV